MTPILRTAAIAAGAIIVPAAIAATVAYQRPRSLPQRLSDRIRGLWVDDTTPDGAMRRMNLALDALHDRIDVLAARRHDMQMPQIHAPHIDSRQAGIAGAILMLLVPAALAPILFPEQTAALRERVSGWLTAEEEEDVERELAGLSERMERLNADIERSRDANYDAITAAAEQPS